MQKISVDITYHVPCPQLPESVVLAVVEETLETWGKINSFVAIDVVFLHKTEIAVVNGTWRGKAVPTDVISLPFCDTMADVLQSSDKYLELGDVILCPEDIIKKARQSNIDEQYLFLYTLSHGVLHLVGFDHEEEMFAIQEMVVTKCISRFARISSVGGLSK